VKNNLQFFSHDNDARNNWKHKALRSRYGWEGEGRFWALNEMVAEADDCRLDLSRAGKRSSYAEDLGMSLEELDEFLAFLADSELCDLILYENGIVTTKRTQEDLERVERNREKHREVAKRLPRGANGRFDRSNGKKHRSNGGPTSSSTVEQTRIDKTRAEQSNGRLAEFCTALKRLTDENTLFDPFGYDDRTIRRLAQGLEEQEVADLDYVRFVLKRVHQDRTVKHPGRYVRWALEKGQYLEDWRKDHPADAQARASPATGGEVQIPGYD
jgi:hypothetical protein